MLLDNTLAIKAIIHQCCVRTAFIVSQLQPKYELKCASETKFYSHYYKTPCVAFGIAYVHASSLSFVIMRLQIVNSSKMSQNQDLETKKY